MPKIRKVSEIETELEALRSEFLELDALDEPDDAQVARSTEIVRNLFPALQTELATATEHEDAAEAVRSFAAAGYTEGTDVEVQRARPAGRSTEYMRQVEPFEILRSGRQNMDDREYAEALRSSNLKAIEEHHLPAEGADSFDRVITRHRRDTEWQKQILARSRPEYMDGFQKYIVGQQFLMTDVERAAMAVGTNTAGGFLVPTHLDPTLILTNTGAKDVVRTLSRVVTLSGGANTWNGVSTAGSTASWDGELTEVSDDTPPIARVSVPTYKAQSLIQASIESFEDIPGLAEDVRMLLADSRTRLEAAAHMTGSGSGQPTGIFTALDANTNVEVSLATGSTFTRADLAGIANSLGDRWTDGSRWLMHPTMLERIAALGSALGANYSTDMTQRPTQQLLGFPVETSFQAPSTFQTTTVDNLMVFGLFSNYLIVDKPGSLAIEFIPHLFNTSNNLPDGRRGWYMHWRNGADSINDLAFRLLQDKTTA